MMLEQSLCVTAIYELPFNPLPDTLPLTHALVPAGTPTGEIEPVSSDTSLADLLIRNPVATYLVRVEGAPMPDAGIQNGDLLVVDRSQEAKDGKIVIVTLNGKLVVRRYILTNGQAVLSDDHPAHEPINLKDLGDEALWGVATYSIHSVNKTGNEVSRS